MTEQAQTHDEAIREIWQLFKGMGTRLDRRFAETDARLDRRFAETDEKIKELSAMFTSQWGKMIEAMVEPDAIRLFQERGIPVQRTYQRLKSRRDGRHMEIDLVLENDADMVVIEAKSTLGVQDVRDFLDRMDEFLLFFPRCRDYRVYGGVAGMDIVEHADRFAYRQGLFVLAVAGEGLVKILNDAVFKPKNFAE